MAVAESAPARSRLAAFGLYGSMILGSVFAFLWIGSMGASISAPAPTTGEHFGRASALPHADALVRLLIALVAVIVTSRALGALFRYLHQPPVIGEVVAGILLGPSLLGHVAPEVTAQVFSPAVASQLRVLAQLGVILYMFIVGIRLERDHLRSRASATAAIAHTSIAVPFLLGATGALWLYPLLSSADVPFIVFAMFLGLSLSVTAFPVLARILTDWNIEQTRLGTTALTCAAVGDVTAWCLLAITIGMAQARPGAAVLTVSLTLLYIVVMFAAVRPIVERICRRQDVRGGQISRASVVFGIVALMVSALVTELIGIHALFGAFLMGAVIPHDSLLARELVRRLEDIVHVILLPTFFAFIGLKTELGLVSGFQNWAICALIIFIACLGKIGGSAVAARFTGMSVRDSASLGVLMNTRGLMELIVLNIGLEMKVISPTLFAMLVIMAVVTTFATPPLLHALTRRAEPTFRTLELTERP